LIDYCRAKNVRLMDGFMWPHHPRTARIRQLLERGDIGQVRHVNGVFTFPLELVPTNIRLNAESAGGSLLDVGCYPVYGIRWALVAEPASAFAVATFQNDVDLSMSGLLAFADGRTATFDCGFTLPFRSWLEIVGTEGIVRVPEMWVPPVARAIYEVERGGKTEIFASEGEDQIAQMIEDFGTAVFEKRDPSPSPEEAVNTLTVLDALAKSARSGQVERVS
jgi:xylose dehydrogenase (NAD/NADP)